MKGLVGQQIKQFHIKSMLGQGSSGTVYQATDLKRKQIVAVKFANSTLAGNSQARNQFLREAEVTEKLNHPHVVQVYEAGRERDLLYLVMAYYAQGNLTQALTVRSYRNESMTLREVLIIVSQIAEALSYAHEGGIIHGDIKPDNVLVEQAAAPESDTDWQVALSDFGLAQLIDEVNNNVATQRAGSWPYIAPERFGTGEIRPSADIYSLGVLFYQLATGKLPFEPSSWDEAEVMHVQELPESPSGLNIDLPIAAERVIQRAMAKQPGERYQSGREFAEAMRQLSQQLLGSAVVAVPASQGLTAWPTQSVGVVSGIDSSLIQANQLISETEDRITVSRASPTMYGLEGKQVVTIGRSPDSDVPLDAPSVSNRHASLRRTEDGWEIVDLGSANGVYLDRDHLLPDVGQLWKPHQTMRVGPFYLRLQMVEDTDQLGERLLLGLNPTRSEVLLGDERTIEIVVVNQSQQRDLLKFDVESNQSSWIFLVQDTVELAPNQRASLELKMRPPQLQTELVEQDHRYKLVATSLLRPEQPLSIEGTVYVEASHDFEVHGERLEFHKKGVVELDIHNNSPIDKLFTMRVRQRHQGMVFGPWRGLGLVDGLGDLAEEEDKEAAEEKRKLALPSTKRLKRFQKHPIITTLNRIPLFKRFVTQPIQRSIVVLQLRELRQVGNHVKRYQKIGSKLIDETGHAFDLSKLRGQSRRENSHQVARFDGKWEEIEATFGVPQRDVALLAISTNHVHRPWFGRKRNAPFEIEIGTQGQQPQRLDGNVSIKPRIPMWATILGSLLLISALIYGTMLMRSNHGWLAFFDTDGDSLSDGRELYQYRTDPLRKDSDGDRLPDPLELLLNTNPMLADSDEDGIPDNRETLPLAGINISDWDDNQNDLLDGQERVHIEKSDVLKADTDGDGFEDGLEIETCNDPTIPDNTTVMRERCDIQAPPTPELRADDDDRLNPVMITDIITLTLTNVVTQHGTILLTNNPESPYFLQNDIVAIGDRAGGQQRSILTFSAANLPQNSHVHSARLELWEADRIGAPNSLGSIWIDVAAANGFGDELIVTPEDFQASAVLSNIAQLHRLPIDEDLTMWTADLRWAASQFQTATQIRLFTSLANNHNPDDDQVIFAPLELSDGAEQQPKLIIIYSYEDA